MSVRVLLMIVLLGMMQTSLGHYHAKGWQWYSKPKEIPVTDEDIAINHAESPTQVPVNYTAELKAFQAQYEEAQAKAVITQNIEDVAEAMRLRQFMMESSKRYGVAFQKALLQYPELSHQLKYPTQDAARTIFAETEQRKKRQVIADYAKTHGLFLFYNGNDAYTPLLTNTIQSFASEYHLHVIGVAIDGQPSPHLKSHVTESGQMTAWEVKALPALVLYDHTTQTVQPFAYGFISANQIADQFLALATDYGQQPLKETSHALT